MAARRAPPVATKPPVIPPGHERRFMIADGGEDVAGVLARVRDPLTGKSWAVAIVGRPHRVKEIWLFIVETARLPVAS